MNHICARPYPDVNVLASHTPIDDTRDDDGRQCNTESDFSYQWRS